MKILTISLVIFFQFIKNQTVCSLRELREELKEDLKDNKALDCRKIEIPPQQGKEHDKEDIKKRQEGVWNSDCSFQADINIWKQQLLENFQIKKIYNPNGLEENPDNYQFQAHLCMIIRTIIFESKKRKNEDLLITVQDIDSFNCPGKSQLDKVCAATSGNFPIKNQWQIFLQEGGLSVQGIRTNLSQKTE